MTMTKRKVATVMVVPTVMAEIALMPMISKRQQDTEDDHQGSAASANNQRLLPIV
jgi:hypothetical protein